MQCTSCGQTLPERAKFCLRCGTEVSAPMSSRAIAAPQSIAGQVGSAAGTVTREFLRAGPKVWIAVVIFVLVLVVLSFLDSSNNNKSEKQREEQQKQQQVAEQKKRDAEVAAFNVMTPSQHIERALLAAKPDATLDAINEAIRNLDAIPVSAPEAATAKALKRKLAISKARLVREQKSGSDGEMVPPPHFRIYRASADRPTSIVVSTSTTDDQLRSLLWGFRRKVRSNRFSDLGLTRQQLGVLSSGMLVIFRGTKCANEDYTNSMPCGYGEHDDAYYQWGIDGDPNKDGAGIRLADGNQIVVFHYTDNWQPPK